MLLHLWCLIDGWEFILSYLIVLLKWGVSRLTEGATKERGNINWEKKREVGERVDGKLTHQGRGKSIKILDRHTLTRLDMSNVFMHKCFRFYRALCRLN